VAVRNLVQAEFKKRRQTNTSSPHTSSGFTTARTAFEDSGKYPYLQLKSEKIVTGLSLQSREQARDRLFGELRLKSELDESVLNEMAGELEAFVYRSSKLTTIYQNKISHKVYKIRRCNKIDQLLED